MARKLIEKYRRNLDLVTDHCIPITLSDGQEWYFPRVIVELRPKFVGTMEIRLWEEDDPNRPRVTVMNYFLTCGEPLDRLIKAISAATNPIAEIEAVLLLGALLLHRNYSDLAQEELEQLFVFRGDDPASRAMLQAIIGVATGNLHDIAGVKALSDPKHYAVG